jgi:hypothetical protein
VSEGQGGILHPPPDETVDPRTDLPDFSKDLRSTGQVRRVYEVKSFSVFFKPLNFDLSMREFLLTFF